jgi:hypothetical protein
VFDVLAASEEIEGDVQDMVGFVVRLMPLEHLKVAVDILDEADFLSQEEHGTDAASTETANAISVFVVDVAGRHHGYRPLGTGRIVEPFLNSPSSFLEESLFACRPFFSESSAHSKAPLFWRSEDVFSPPLFQKPAGFSSFFFEISPCGL